MAKQSPLQVQGLCRFSFVCTGGFKKFHKTVEERRAALYDPGRLTRRMLWFRHICLPAIAAQSDADFTLHILTGDDLPKPWRSELIDLTRPIRQIKLHFLPAMDHREACRQVLLGGRDPDRPMVAEFRLDDDDAVATNFVHSTRRTYARAARLSSRLGRLAIDQGKGMVLRATDTGDVSAHPILTHAWAPGLALAMPVGDEGTVMDFPHHKVWMRMPFVHLSEQMMFIRGDHGMNDAKTPWSSTGRVPLAEADIPEVLRDRFNIDLPAFRKAWQETVAG